jgi:integrating conjugative element protein (TIGR03746 family)
MKDMKDKNHYRGWVAHAWRKEDADAEIIRVQKISIFILLIVCAVLGLGWMRAPSRLTVYIPPDIQNGSTLKSGTVPAPLIYSFAYEVWQELNYWPVDGEHDYQKNIATYMSYMTMQFKSELLEDYAALKASGQLQRIRYLQGLNGAAYDAANIKQLSSNTWEVDLIMRLTEYKNNQPIKDIEMMYPLKVIRSSISPGHNPYGLQIAGFLSEPQRTTTYI